jgi:hypothetical protein
MKIIQENRTKFFFAHSCSKTMLSYFSQWRDF